MNYTLVDERHQGEKRNFPALQGVHWELHSQSLWNILVAAVKEVEMVLMSGGPLFDVN